MKLKVVHDDNAAIPDKGKAYFNCSLCLRELPFGTAPKEYASQQVSITQDGIQVWCTRHNCNIDLITWTIEQ